MDEKSEAQSSASADQYFLEIGGVLHPMSREYYEEIVKPWQDLWDEVLKRQDEQIANYHPRYDFLLQTVEGSNLRRPDKKPCDPTGNQGAGLRGDSMTRIVRDPNRSFGRPTIEGRNLRVDIIAEMFRAGDSIATICDLYELTIEQVEAALRYEMQRETKGEQR